MATKAHATVTDPNIHEPKNITTAAANTVYVSTGGGTGNWEKAYCQGFDDYNDSGSSQSLTSGSFVDLTNDGAGSNTLTTYRLPGAGAVWSTADNQFEWDTAGLVLGDTVDIRVDFTVTTAATNRDITLGLDMAHGDPDEYRLVLGNWQLKSAAAYSLTAFTSIYMGNTATLDNPAKLVMKTDGAGDAVVLKGFYVRVVKRNPIWN